MAIRVPWEKHRLEGRYHEIYLIASKFAICFGFPLPWGCYSIYKKNGFSSTQLVNRGCSYLNECRFDRYVSPFVEWDIAAFTKRSLAKCHIHPAMSAMWHCILLCWMPYPRKSDHRLTGLGEGIPQQMVVCICKKNVYNLTNHGWGN